MREEPALSADQSPRPPLSLPEQGDGKQSELPRLHFPQRPDGQGLAPAPGGYAPPPPPAPAPRDGQAPAPGDAPPAPPPPPSGGMPQAPPPGTAPPGAQAPPGTPPDWAHRWGPQPGAPGGPGPRRPPRPAQPPRPPEPVARQRAIAALILGVLSLLALLGIGSNFHRGIYLVAFSLAVGISACWFGITAMRKARLAVTMRPRGAIAGIVLGVIGALLSVVLLIALAAFWQQLNSFSNCLNQANTPSAQQACVSQLHRSVNVSKLSG
jgi:hypothetical protein